MSADDLDPIAPEAALDLYLEQRRGELSDATHRSHSSRLEWFVQWCQTEDITNLNPITGRDLHAYRVWRREQNDIKPVTLKTQLSTLRVFLDFCESIDAVPDDLKQKVLLPEVTRAAEKSDSTLEYERAKRILDHLHKYEYASRDHLIFSLLWRTGMRQGSLRALDLGDYDREDLALEVRHRPETGTPLKNQERGERDVALDTSLQQLLDNYIDGRRPNKTDDTGRAPLLATDQGRPHRSTIRSALYRYTRPCFIGLDCPHDRNEADCEATRAEYASRCPSARSPHDVRSGAITAHLLEDVPVEIVSERMDVSQKTLDKHYDRRSKREKMEQRREFLRRSSR